MITGGAVPEGWCWLVAQGLEGSAERPNGAACALCSLNEGFTTGREPGGGKYSMAEITRGIVTRDLTTNTLTLHIAGLNKRGIT